MSPTAIKGGATSAEQEAAPSRQEAAPKIKIDTVTGRPFASNKAAREEMRRQGLSDEDWGTCEYHGGFAIASWREIVKMREAREKSEAEALEAAKERHPMKYFRVTLSPGPLGEVALPVTIGGMGSITLVASKEAIIAEPFLEVLKNSQRRNLVPIDPSKNPRQNVAYEDRGPIYEHPFIVHGEATEQEFRDFCHREGRIVADAMARQQADASAG